MASWRSPRGARSGSAKACATGQHPLACNLERKPWHRIVEVGRVRVPILHHRLQSSVQPAHDISGRRLISQWTAEAKGSGCGGTACLCLGTFEELLPTCVQSSVHSIGSIRANRLCRHARTHARTNSRPPLHPCTHAPMHPCTHAPMRPSTLPSIYPPIDIHVQARPSFSSSDLT